MLKALKDFLFDMVEAKEALLRNFIFASDRATLKDLFDNIRNYLIISAVFLASNWSTQREYMPFVGKGLFYLALVLTVLNILQTFMVWNGVTTQFNITVFRSRATRILVVVLGIGIAFSAFASIMLFLWLLAITVHRGGGAL